MSANTVTKRQKSPASVRQSMSAEALKAEDLERIADAMERLDARLAQIVNALAKS